MQFKYNSNIPKIIISLCKPGAIAKILLIEISYLSSSPNHFAMLFFKSDGSNQASTNKKRVYSTGMQSATLLCSSKARFHARSLMWSRSVNPSGTVSSGKISSDLRQMQCRCSTWTGLKNNNIQMDEKNFVNLNREESTKHREIFNLGVLFQGFRFDYASIVTNRSER